WRTVGIERARAGCEPSARTDRLGYELRRRCLARPPTDAAGKGRICVELDRSCHSLCDLTSVNRNHTGRHGNAPTVRGCAYYGPKRPAAGQRARAAGDTMASLCRRGTVINCDCRPGDAGSQSMSALGGKADVPSTYLNVRY